MIIDITYEINHEFITYPGNPPFAMKRVQNIKNGDACNVTEITIGSHMGTHIDAPLHFLEDGDGVDQIPLERINGKARVIEVSRNVIDFDLIESLEIGRDDILIFKTVNAWNFDGKQVLLDYVTLDYESALYLSEKRISMVGIDYLTIELPRAKRKTGENIHKILLSNNIFILEGLDLRNVKEGVYDLICMPLKLKDCDGSPVRTVLKTYDS